MSKPKKIQITTAAFDLETNAALQNLMAEGYEVALNPYERKLTEAEAADLLSQGVVGVIAGVEPLTDAVFEKAEDLKVLVRSGTGMDSVDQEAAARRGIVVDRTPDPPAPAVAEIALGLMLDAMRRLAWSNAEVKAGRWSERTGQLLSSQRVGVVGYGRSGKRVAHLAKAFGAEVVVCDPVLAEAGASEAEGFPVLGFDALIETATLVTLHCPAEKGAPPMFGPAVFDRMKDGSILINTARGTLIDEEALEAALRNRKIAHAGLDVFLEEPYRGPLLDLDNVTVTPHIASNTKEIRHAMENEAADKLRVHLLALEMAN